MSWRHGFEAGLRESYLSAGFTGNFLVVSTAAAQHTSVTGLGGDYALEIGYFGGGVYTPTLDAQYKHLHFWLRPKSLGSPSTTWVTFYASGVQTFRVEINAGGTVEAFRGATSVGSAAFVPTAPHWFEIALIADNAGSVVVKVDSASVISFSGDTQNAASSGWTSFSLEPTTAAYAYLDDIVCTTAAEGSKPELYGTPRAPSSDYAVDFTRSTGASNFAIAATRPAQTTNYNEGTVALEEDFYGLTALPAAASIDAVAVHAYIGREGTISDGEAAADVNGVKTYSDPVTLPAAPGYGLVSFVMDENPDTAAPWEEADMSTLRAGGRIS